MYLERFYDETLAQASYLVGCQATGEAIVIDPARHVEPYLERAQAQGLSIIAVTETHIHADFVSGTRELASRCGARMYLSDEGDAAWKYQFAGPDDQLVKDGHTITIGNLTLEVMHTPGHTPEHISFLLTDHPATSQPIGAFTGDFVFVGDVGRPDLLEKAAGVANTMEQGARDLYASLQRFASQPDHLQIWPAHGAGSACGKALGAVPQSVLGYEKVANWAFQCKSEEEFVAKILDGQPEPPHYFAEMKRVNKVGPALLKELGAAAKLSGPQLAQKLEAGELVIDLRGAEAFAAGHLKGAIFLPPVGLARWAGWVLPYSQPLFLLTEADQDVDRLVRALRSIGLDRIAGFSHELSGPTVASRRVKPEQLTSTEGLLDIRGLSEWNAGHAEGAKHLHLGKLTSSLEEIPESPTLYCGSGLRSLIGSSLLERASKQPTDVIGGFAAMRSLVATA